jgi:hypothetical protein
MFQQVIKYLKEKEWVYSPIEDKTVAILGISGNNGKFQCVIDVREQENKIIFFSIFGSNVPENKRVGMAELITRLNYEKFLGNFDMDFETGQVRYKTSLFYGNTLVDDDIIDNLIMANITTMDLSLEGFMQYIYGGLTPPEAYSAMKENE